MAEYYGAGEDAIYLSGIAAGAATKTGTVGYVVPFAIPEVIRHTNAFALGVQKAHPGAKVKIIWTNSWFDPAKEKKAAENLALRGRRRARAERRQPGGRPVRGVGGHAVGRLRLERAEVRAEVVAHRRRLQLGPVLHEAGQGSDERHVEDGQLLRQHEGRLHAARAVRPGRLRGDEGADRRRAGADHQRQVERVQRPDLRPEGQAAHQGRSSRDVRRPHDR